MENLTLRLKGYTRFADHQAAALKVVHYAEELIPEHEHDFFELVAVYKGDGIHILDGVPIPIYPNELFLVFPGHKHHYEKFSHLSLLTLMFSPSILAPYMDEFNRIEGFQKLFRKNSVPGQLHFMDDLATSKLDNLVFLMTEEQMNMQPGVPVMLTILLLEAILLISRKCFDVSGDEAAGTSKLAPVIRHMEKNLQAKLTLKGLSLIAGMSVPNFCKFFKSRLDVSPIQYLLKLRIQKAKALLSHSSLSITEISERTGFNDANYFSRQFMHIVGVQPHVYRNTDHGILHTPGLDLKAETSSAGAAIGVQAWLTGTSPDSGLTNRNTPTT